MTIKLDHTNNSISGDNGIIKLDQTGAVILATGNTAARPSATAVGMTRINNDLSNAAVMEFYNGSQWYKVVANPAGTLDDLTPLTIAQALL